MQLQKVKNTGKSTLAFNGRDATTGEMQTFRVAPGDEVGPVYADPDDAAFVQHEGAVVTAHKGAAPKSEPPPK